MALTLTKVAKYVEGDRTISIVDAKGDNAYPSGGYSIAPGQLGLRNSITYIDDTVSDGGFVAHYVPSTGKLKCFKVGAAGALAEVAATDVNNVTFRLRAEGK